MMLERKHVALRR